MKSIYDIIVEDLGDEREWPKFVYNILGRENYDKITYNIATDANINKVKFEQRLIRNNIVVNIYPEIWLRAALSQELEKYGVKTSTRTKPQNTSVQFKQLLHEIFNIFFVDRVYLSGPKKGEVYHTLTNIGKEYFMDACCARLLLKTLSCSFHTDYAGGYVLESDLCSLLNRKTVVRTFSFLQTENNWVVENLHGTGRYRIGIRENKMIDPIVAKVNKLAILATRGKR